MAARLLPILAVILVGMTVIQTQSPQVDYDILLNNQEYVKIQLQCVLGKELSKCDKIGNRIRQLLPENAQTGTCPNCNEQEKIYIVKVAQKIKKQYPAEWEELLTLYNVNPAVRDGFLQTKA